VINLSLGSDRRELVIEQAIYKAVRKGSLVVGAAGNDGDDGSPLGYPASLPHVLTVGATGRDDASATFSSRSRFVDLAAPGQDIQVATALGKGFQSSSGTSFAAPLVSGAAAWVWTARPELDATQLFEVMRRSARDVDAPGRDDATGFGILDVTSALTYPAPASDPLEPNDDLDFVQPDGVYYTGVPALTTKRRPTMRLQARLDVVEDPRDVYRVFVPKGRTLRAVASSSDADVDLTLWKEGAVSVKQRVAGSDRLARAVTSGPTETLRYRNTGPGRFAYLAVRLPKGVRQATYGLHVSAGS
jgi:subtilisin family serine protease